MPPESHTNVTRSFGRCGAAGQQRLGLSACRRAHANGKFNNAPSVGAMSASGDRLV